MTRKTKLALMLPPLTLLAASLQAAELVTPSDAATEAAEPSSITTTAVITPRLFAFDYVDGVGEDKTHFLERYDYREGFSGDTRTDVFADLDIDLTMNNGERDLFVLERRGFGRHNHDGKAKYSNEMLNVYGNYSHYRSATGGIDYLLSPGQVPGGTGGGGGGLGGGFVNTFNDDANRFDYQIDRTTYGAGFKVKPAALGNMATISVDYAGYRRDGSKFAPFLLDNLNNVEGDGWGQNRWRGISLNVDEHMNRVGLTVSASPKKLFEVAYEVAYEEFTNKSGELQLQRDITDPAGVTLPIGLAPDASERIASLFYIPDTRLINHGIRASKNYNDRVMLAAGYGASWLKQDSFSELELASGHTRGRITTDNAYLTANAIVSPDVSVEGHITYYNHDNDSTATDTLIATTTAPRINSINSMDYGIAASWRPDFYSSNLTLGWNRIDKERDLTFGTSGQAILPAQTLYREDTLSDEVYLKWNARPALGWNLRVTPSYTWADKTGLVTEPEEAFKLKSMLSYAAPAGWVVNGFYDYTDKRNSNNTFTDGDGAAAYVQDIDNTLHSAGASLNVTPRDYVNTFVSLYWMQNDFSSYLFHTSNPRWTNNVVFTLLDEPNYKVDSLVFSLGGEWEFSDKISLNGGYTYSKSRGDVASGVVLDSLVTATGTVDARIDNTLHSFALGGDYAINPKAKLRVHYVYDQYDDKAYDLLSGGVHVIAVGVAFTL
jgi:hypothetical protein